MLVNERLPEEAGTLELKSMYTIRNFAQGKFQLDGMVSHYIPFDQVDQVFQNMLHPVKDMKKMVIVFGE